MMWAGLGVGIVSGFLAGVVAGVVLDRRVRWRAVEKALR